MTESKITYDIHRSGLSIVSYQLAGVCDVLSKLMDSDDPVGDESVELLKAIEQHARLVISAKTFEGRPAFPAKVAKADLLFRAFTLRATVAAFLSPDEAAEQQAKFGFGTRGQS